MAQKPRKDGADRSVMGNLPTTRPDRLSRRARPASGSAPADAPADRAPAPRKAAATRSASSARPAPRPKAVRAGSPALGEPARKAVAGRAAADEGSATQEQSGTDIAATVVKAAGELAQIGATVAGQLIKRAAGRIPRP